MRRYIQKEKNERALKTRDNYERIRPQRETRGTRPLKRLGSFKQLESSGCKSEPHLNIQSQWEGFCMFVCLCVFAWMWLCVWRWSHPLSDQRSTSDSSWQVHTLLYKHLRLSIWPQKDSGCDGGESKSHAVNSALWDHSGLGWTIGVSTFVCCAYTPHC